MNTKKSKRFFAPSSGLGKKGFIWVFFKKEVLGFVIGFIVAIVLMYLLVNGIIPLAIPICP